MVLLRNARHILSSIKHLRLNKQLRLDFFCKKIVKSAYEEGFRLFDTGRLYAYSEREIGRALKGINREDYFLLTKITSMDLEKKGAPKNVIGNLELSLKYLNANYVDLYLLHHPHGDWINIYKQMEEAKLKGMAKHIGVCNFKPQHFDELMKYASVEPEVCQAECHPLYTNLEVRRYCIDHGILFMAHTPTGRICEKIKNNRCLQMLSTKYDKTIAQIILRWHYQNSVVPIVNSVNTRHMKENLDIFDFQLSANEMEMIEQQNEDYVMVQVANGPDSPNFIYNL
jgi:diketogulonate reductase-like aldo/keto reductase